MAETAVRISEERNKPRRRINKLGQIEVDGTPSVLCTVRNMSDSGALIMVRHSADIPNEIVLVIPEDEFRRSARVKWRRVKSIGVMFV